MSSRGKHKRRRQLRIYSHADLTPEEASALGDNLANTELHPVAFAVIGGVMVEHALDKHLRRRFSKVTDEEWEILVSDNGPLSSFYSKILLGRAFRIFDEKTQGDINIVRVVRNAFAHSKKLIDFNDQFICDELAEAKHIDKRFAKELKRGTKSTTAKVAYACLCFALSTKLSKRHTRAIEASTKRIRKKLARSPLGSVLLRAFAQAQPTGIAVPFPGVLVGPSVGPIGIAPGGPLSEFLQKPTSGDDSKGK